MTAPVAYGVASKPDWPSTSVFDAGGLVVEKSVSAMCGENHKEPLKANVLQVRCSSLLPPRTSPLRDVDAVAGDDLVINDTRVLALGNAPNHVEEIPLAHEGHGQLLNESANRRCFRSVHHLLSPETKKDESVVVSAQPSLKAKNLWETIL